MVSGKSKVKNTEKIYVRESLVVVLEAIENENSKNIFLFKIFLIINKL